MGGFMPDIHSVVGQAVFEGRQCLLARAARREFIDLTTTNTRIVLLSWAHSLLAFGQESGDRIVLMELEAGAPQHLTTLLLDLSDDTHELLELLDIVFLAELVETCSAPAPPTVVPWLASHATQAATKIATKASARKTELKQ
jgi:hypothetical protein